ncbi:hypothetical protein M2132_001844 [Dysgonomonas sp. PH5-45]|uniref:hypothetical protein n=1 Tax=unclassified Dysgonomonas TaxID=2630389 RepID=UPI002476B975|nr:MULTISPECIES: hypothetical protein [unclassified Dysgonomonas]MDH6355501.1 hypothetical protein [Dysgonomonas sp. PH5-45]MDH6388397.1 hypothetical protein [Dysgonomonas sp. PH5-37]
MKRIIIPLIAFICMSIVLSCGKNVETERKKTLEQETEKEKREESIQEIVPMSIEISDTEPTDGGSFILTIRGGKPFNDIENPFKIESKYIGNYDSHYSEIFLQKFEKELDGSYKIEINTASSSESEQQLIVTDANGVSKTVNYTIQYYP